MRKVLLDANFLVLPFQFNVDLFGELDRLLGEQYTVYTLQRTYNEARDLEDGAYRQVVERLVDEADIEVITVQSGKEVDDVLVDLAGEYVVCTNDRAVRAELREARLPHIYLRQQNYLEGEALGVR